MRKRKVYWTPQETLAIDAFVEAHALWPKARAIMAAQKALLPENRHVVSTTVYNALSTGSYDRKIIEAKAKIGSTPLIEHKVEMPIQFVGDEPDDTPPPPITLDQRSVDVVAERVSALIIPQVIDAMRDLMISNRLSKMMPTDEDIRELIHKNPVILQRAESRRRVDILGLLPAQAQVVKDFIGQREDVKLRFILSEHAARVNHYAPDVIVCTGFISHSHQDRVRKSGSRIHFANGAAASVTNVLSGLVS